MGYRHHFYIDDETKDILDTIPDKKRSDFVRFAVKKAAKIEESQPESPLQKPRQRVEIEV